MPPIQRTFTRAAKSKVGTDFYLASGVFVIRHSLIENSRLRRTLHGKWCEIKSDTQSVYRVIQFSPRLKGAARDDAESEIIIDWQGWLRLSGYAETTPEALPLTIVTLPWWKQIFAAWHHPEPSMRLSSQIALSLGALSLFFAALSLFLSLML